MNESMKSSRTYTRKKAPVLLRLRQGDVLLTPVAKLPKGATKQSHTGPAVLAYGEVTGHAHTVEHGQLYTDGNGLTYLTVEELTKVRHQEHDAITLQPGVYRVTRQREWTDADEPRQVAD